MHFKSLHFHSFIHSFPRPSGWNKGDLLLREGEGCRGRGRGGKGRKGRWRDKKGGEVRDGKGRECEGRGRKGRWRGKSPYQSWFASGATGCVLVNVIKWLLFIIIARFYMLCGVWWCLHIACSYPPHVVYVVGSDHSFCSVFIYLIMKKIFLYYLHCLLYYFAFCFDFNVKFDRLILGV